MKKIVALVLCLAMVLALGTVAFADTKTTTIKVKVLDKDNKVVAALADATKVETSKVTTTSGSTTTTEYYADKYVAGDKTYAAVSADAAWEAKIVDKDGKLLATVVEIATGSDLKTSAVITKSGVGTGKTGDYKKDAEYVVIDGKAYAVEDGEDWAVNAKGEFVNYDAENELPVKEAETTKAAKKEKGYVIYNADGKLIAFKDDDGKQYDVVASVPASYTGKVGTITIDGTAYTYLLGAAAAAATTSNVTSAKTFDAGVAMYAGLALMSVAGSAVVIGKKKEF